MLRLIQRLPVILEKSHLKKIVLEVAFVIQSPPPILNCKWRVGDLPNTWWRIMFSCFFILAGTLVSIENIPSPSEKSTGQSWVKTWKIKLKGKIGTTCGCHFQGNREGKWFSAASWAKAGTLPMLTAGQTVKAPRGSGSFFFFHSWRSRCWLAQQLGSWCHFILEVKVFYLHVWSLKGAPLP